MKKTLLLALLIIGATASAQWHSNVIIDDFTDVRSSIPYVVGTQADAFFFGSPKLSYDIKKNKFRVSRAGYFMPDGLTLKLRIDKGKVYHFVSTRDLNDITFRLSEEIIQEMTEGTILLIRDDGSNSAGRPNNLKFSLGGFTRELNKAQ